MHVEECACANIVQCGGDECYHTCIEQEKVHAHVTQVVRHAKMREHALEIKEQGEMRERVQN